MRFIHALGLLPFLDQTAPAPLLKGNRAVQKFIFLPKIFCKKGRWVGMFLIHMIQFNRLIVAVIFLPK